MEQEPFSSFDPFTLWWDVKRASTTELEVKIFKQL